MKSDVIKYFNANPWKKDIGDCAIRAVVMGIGMKYELVCREFGVSWKRGYGMIRDTGIQLDDIKTVFDPYFDKVEDYAEDMPPELAVDPEFADMLSMNLSMDVSTTSSGLTLADFVDLYAEQGNFLVGLVDNPASNSRSRDDGHIVCARCLRGRKGFAIDTFDSSEMLVDSYMRIRKSLSKDDPRHWVYDKEHRCFAGYGMEKPA